MSPNGQPSFLSLGVAAEICDGLATRDITHAFAIQELCLPLALAGKDLIGQARTGMGKTYGFGIPLLDRVFDDAHVTPPDGSPRALVIVPTRELCIQVADDLTIAAQFLPEINVLALYGGVKFETQIQQLQQGHSDVLVGTPGRLLDLHRRGELVLENVEIVVLDEADEMLDQGFLDDVQALIAETSENRQMMLFSATMPGPIMALSRTFMRHPVQIRADQAQSQQTHATTTQLAFQSHKLDRMSALARILQTPGRGRTMVFTRTKKQAAFVASDLGELGFAAGAIHGDMRQHERQQCLEAFREGTVDVLVATDVAARGIDVEDVTHVINYQCPDDDRAYVHRIGRTGRAGHTGMAVTLVGWDEVDRFNALCETLNLDLSNPPQWFSSSPEFLEAFALPSAVTDRVGSPRRVLGARSPHAR